VIKDFSRVWTSIRSFSIITQQNLSSFLGKQKMENTSLSLILKKSIKSSKRTWKKKICQRSIKEKTETFNIKFKKNVNLDSIKKSESRSYRKRMKKKILVTSNLMTKSKALII
jgi:hypothetical protein